MNLRRQVSVERFETTVVSHGDVIEVLAETGTAQMLRTVEVKSTISGKIRSLLVEVGDSVKRDQLLAIIEPGPAQALQLLQQRAQVDRARLELKRKETAYGRKKQLFNNALATSEEFEISSIEWTKAQHNLQLAELELEILEIQANVEPGIHQDLVEVQILAPLEGLVIERNAEVGEVVASATASYTGGLGLFRIGDPSQIVVKADISEIDAGRIKVGQSVDIVADAYPDSVYQGRVQRIAPIGERKQGRTIVTFDTVIEVLGPTPTLRQGMSCDIDIILTRRDDTLYLPVESVLKVSDDLSEVMSVTSRERHFVFVVNEASEFTSGTNAETSSGGVISLDKSRIENIAFPLESFFLSELVTGIETLTRIEILSGLDLGDRVAGNPRELMKRLDWDLEDALSKESE